MRKVFVGILSVMLAFSLAGCGSKQTAPEFNPQYYPACYDPIAKLCKDQDNSSEIKGAATGAAIGALGGALAGGLSSGSWKGAAVGAAAGAVAGGMTGFFTARLAKISDRNERLKTYKADLKASSEDWDLKTASVKKAAKCYSDQIEALQKAYKDKKISKEEGLARLNEIKAAIKNINDYWADAQNKINASIADSDVVLKDEKAKGKNADPQMFTAGNTYKKTMQKNKESTTKQVADAGTKLDDCVKLFENAPEV